MRCGRERGICDTFLRAEWICVLGGEKGSREYEKRGESVSHGTRALEITKDQSKYAVAKHVFFVQLFTSSPI